jgi:ABC-type Na+ efflux pump permease subunit
MNPDHLDSSEPGTARERDIAAHIFTTSSVMLGLCLTIISIMRGQRNPGGLETIVDDTIAIAALVFLLACFLSYTALRVRHLRRIHRVESVADTVFLIGMTCMGVACVLFVWTIF